MSSNPDNLIADYGRFSVHQEEADNGHKFTWIHPGDCVAVIPYDDNGFWLGDQYRVPVELDILSTCAGKIDDEETAFEAAERELMEEFGMYGKKWLRLTSFYSSEGITDEYTTIFALKDPQIDGNAELDIFEDIKVRYWLWAELDFVLALANNAKLLIGLMALDRQRKERDFRRTYGRDLRGEHKFVAVPSGPKELS